jgi:hypothetical protein
MPNFTLLVSLVSVIMLIVVMLAVVELTKELKLTIQFNRNDKLRLNVSIRDLYVAK